MESRKHRNLLEIRKREIEKELATLDPLREELREIELLLSGVNHPETHIERGGPDDR